MRKNGALAAAPAQVKMTVMPDRFAPPDRAPVIVARERG